MSHCCPARAAHDISDCPHAGTEGNVRCACGNGEYDHFCCADPQMDKLVMCAAATNERLLLGASLADVQGGAVRAVAVDVNGRRWALAATDLDEDGYVQFGSRLEWRRLR